MTTDFNMAGLWDTNWTRDLYNADCRRYGEESEYSL